MELLTSSQRTLEAHPHYYSLPISFGLKTKNDEILKESLDKLIKFSEDCQKFSFDTDILHKSIS